MNLLDAFSEASKSATRLPYLPDSGLRLVCGKVWEVDFVGGHAALHDDGERGLESGKALGWHLQIEPVVVAPEFDGNRLNDLPRCLDLLRADEHVERRLNRRCILRRKF